MKTKTTSCGVRGQSESASGDPALAAVLTPGDEMLALGLSQSGVASDLPPHSKGWRQIFAALFLFAALFTQPSTLHAQPAAPANRVLELDGKESYVQLPPNIFNELTNATVEGWVKWDRLGNWMRFFDFGKQDQTMVIGNSGTSASLGFELFDSNNERAGDVSVPDALIAGRWVHIAVVTGKGGVRIYVNGALRATNPYTGSFAQVGNGSRNFLGRNNWKEADGNVEELQGQMDEVRVWNYARTADQIRAHLFTTLTGRETGLVGLWNFDDGTARDGTSLAHHGKLMGKAKVVEGRRPTQEEWRSTISGMVTNEAGKPVPGTVIILKLVDAEFARTTSDAAGRYTLSFDPVWSLNLLAKSGEHNARVDVVKLQPGEVRTLDLALRELGSRQSKGSLALELDGKDSYVQLPSDIFNGLTEATVEGWVKWDRFGTWTRFFDFGEHNDFGRQSTEMNIGNSGDGLGLAFQIRNSKGEFPVDMTVPGSLKAGRWCHIAVVTGPSGVELFLDGALRATNSYTGSFAAIGNCSRNYLGRNNWKEAAPNVNELQGQMDEVRVWNHARTVEQIRANLFTTLTGKEPGLVGYWNFDAGNASDLSPGQHHGELIGNVKFTPATRENQLLVGKVIAADQMAVADADIQVFSGGQVIATSKSDADGNYYCLITEPVTGPCEIQSIKDELSGWRSNLNLQRNGRAEANLQLSGAFNITGTVTTMDGAQPIEATVVELIAAESPSGTNATIASAATEKSGSFKFLNLKPGEYRLRCKTEKGYVAPIGHEVVKLSENGKPATVQFRVVPPQKGVWRFYTSFDGFDLPYVRDIRVDGQGAMWFATYDGLGRFDGQTFRTFTTRDGLKENGVVGAFGSMMVDREGRLVIPTQQRFNGTTWEPFPAEKPKFPINRLFLARDGTIWAAGGAAVGGASSCKDGVWTHHSMGPDGKANEVWRIAEDSKGTMWFGCAQGIARFDHGEWRYFDDEDGIGNPKNYGYAKPRPGRVMGLGEARGLIVDSKDNVWVGLSFHQGVSRFDGKSWKQFTTEDGLPESEEFPWLHEDRSGHMWVGGGGGLARFENERWTTVRTGDTKAIHDDGNGYLWVGVEEGLGRLDLRHWEAINSQHGLPGNYVSSLTRDSQGRMLIGLGGAGLARYDGKRFERLELPSNVGGVGTVFSDSKSNLWISGGLKGQAYSGTVWSLTEGKWREYHSPGGVAYTFGEDASGHIWASGQWNVNMLEGDAFVQVRNQRADAIARDQKGRLWFAGLSWDGQAKGGVSRFDGEGDDGFLKWTSFGATNGLQITNPRCTLVDRKDRVWVGTWNEGVAQFDGTKWRMWNAHDGMGANSVLDIKEDRDGHIWAAHGKSVSFFDGTAWSVLDSRDGMSLKDATKLLPESDGSMWIAGGGGLLRYTRQAHNVLAPIVRLTAENLKESGANLQTSEVRQGTRLTFDFSARDFGTEPAKVQFRYRWIEGVPEPDAVKADGAWSKPTKERRFEWSTNRVGTYSFVVQSIDRDLNYSKPALATVTIAPLWYRNASIMAPAGGALLGLMGWSGFLTLRYGNKRRETERLREQMIEQERQARAALEAKNTQLESAKVAVETKAAQLEVAKEAAESAKDAAESANRAKSLFLANMSHEIRTPMNAILGYSQILRRDGELPPKDRRPIETIEKSGDHLLAMINDILDLSKIEAGRMELQETDFDLTSLILGLKAMFKVRCEEQDLKLEVEGLGDSPCPVHADEGKLRQVLINLLGNAVKFTERGSVALRVCAGPRSSRGNEAHSSNAERGVRNGESSQNLLTSAATSFRFEIIDTGKGISPEGQAALFQPFQQGTEGMKKGGTGLGLAITKRQVELMGGSIGVESQLGRGSRFFFELSLAPARAEVVAREASPAREVLGLAAGCKVKALVVDDVRQNREVLSQLLEGIGCEVTLADSGPAALEKLRAAMPDIIFMDIRMPDMEGPEVVNRLFAEFGRNRTKLVAISASVLAHEQQSYLAAGFDTFVGKPFRFEEICDCMKRLLPVEFRYAEEMAPGRTAVEAIDPAAVTISRDLKRELKEAADRYSVTKLERGFEELARLGEPEKRAAAYLRSLTQKGDVDEVAGFLEKVRIS